MFYFSIVTSENCWGRVATQWQEQRIGKPQRQGIKFSETPPFFLSITNGFWLLRASTGKREKENAMKPPIRPWIKLVKGKKIEKIKKKKRQKISPKTNWLGWIKWRPLHRDFSITCCDCGLAHRFQI